MRKEFILPKAGTIEREILERLAAAGSEGICLMDVQDLGLSEEGLAEVIERLQHGLYESEADGAIKFDA